MDSLKGVEIEVENLTPHIHCDVKTHVDTHAGSIKVRVILTEKQSNITKELILELIPKK